MSYLDDVNNENLLNVVRDMQAKIQALELKETTCDSLDEISNDMGDQRAGRFLALETGSEPTDADACGSFMSALSILFGEYQIKIGIVKNGMVQFGFGEESGVFSAGDGIIDAEGIKLFGLNYVIKMIGEYLGETRYGKLMMKMPENGDKPVVMLEFSSPAETELLTNGGAEDGDFTGWPISTENNGAWSVADFAATGDHSFSFQYTSGGYPASGQLVSDIIAVTGGLKYTIAGKTALSEIPYTGHAPTRKAIIKWLDASDVLLRTDTLFNLTDSNPSWRSFETVFTAPATATQMYVTFVLTLVYEAIDYFDDFSVAESSISHSMGLDDRGGFIDSSALPSVNAKLPAALWSGIGTAAVAAGSMESSTSYYYKVTFIDEFGETIPASGTGKLAYLGISSHGVNLTNIPLGRSTVTARKIYRTKKSDPLNDFYLVATLADNSTTTYNDRIADADLGAVAPLINTTGTWPLLPTQASWFWDEVTTTVTQTKTLSTSQQFAMYVDTTAANANDGDTYRLGAFLAAGTYSLDVLGASAANCGKLDWYIDDVLVVSGQDWASGAGYNTTKTTTGITISTNGYHVLKAIVNGRNGTDYRIALTKVTLKQAVD